jgi:hypothetical protein
MIHFLKSASLLSLIILSLEPHLSALGESERKRPKTEKLMHVKLKLHAFVMWFKKQQTGKCCHLLIPFW